MASLNGKHEAHTKTRLSYPRPRAAVADPLCVSPI